MKILYSTKKYQIYNGTFTKNVSNPFLDVEITINYTGIETWIYRKSTNTNLFLNLNAMYFTK